MATPDNMEKGIRFGCGFIFGLMVGGVFLAFTLIDSDNGSIAAVIGLGFACALLSLRYGGVFWRVISKCLIWF